MHTPSDYPERHHPHERSEEPRPTGELTLLPQEVALDHPDSCNFFAPSLEKPFVATPAALEAFGVETIVRCLTHLQVQTRLHGGLDYLQVFEEVGTGRRLWFMEDGPGGAITALLPSDH